MNETLPIPAEDLIVRAVRKIHSGMKPRRKDVLWHLVADAFLVGSTSGRAICRCAGFDPDSHGKKSDALTATNEPR